MKKRSILFFLLITAFLAVCATALFARAGGAGGDLHSSHGGDSGGDGLGYLIYIIIRIIFELPFPLNIIVLGLLIGGFLLFSYITRKKVREQTILNRLPDGKPAAKVPGYDEFKKNNPDFDEFAFKGNVRKAFIDIQKAWEAQDINPVRRFISDGVYQRFNTQFTMMRLLKQTNTLKDIKVHNIYPDRIETDGLYDIAHVAIHATINDHFKSDIDSSLNSGGSEEFVEYWSFLKKRGAPKKDIYLTHDCPNCGSPLPENMGEVARCGSCGTLTNSGEYDWVLSEITQADDYINRHRSLRKSADITEKIRRIIDEDGDFSVQLVEDKASNGYLQIITAIALNDPSVMRRFVNDDVFEKIKSMIDGNHLAYNRIYLNDVTLIGVSRSANKNILSIAIKSSYQRVRLASGRPEKIDPVVVSKTEVLLMSRDIKSAESKGSLYAHSCPSCGAPVENSLSINCTYCGTPYNSTGAEWIITGLMDLSEYERYRDDNADNYEYKIDPSLIDRLYDVRDYAFNNVMVVMAADGVFSDEEREFTDGLARRWGYSPDRIEPLFQMARNGRLVIRMPEDAKRRKKIIDMMEKAAGADSTVTPEEQAVLDRIRGEYGS